MKVHQTDVSDTLHAAPAYQMPHPKHRIFAPAHWTTTLLRVDGYKAGPTYIQQIQIHTALGASVHHLPRYVLSPITLVKAAR